jgi:hypothetical protein
MEKIIPKLIDDTFKLTIDLLVPPPSLWPVDKRHLLLAKIHENGFCVIFNGPSGAVSQITESMPMH